MSERRVTFVVPAGIDDPTNVSGGNHYDRRIAAELAAAGWAVGWRPVGDEAALAAALAELPAGAVVLLDGLVAGGAAGVVVPEAARLNLVVLAHMLHADPPPGHDVAGGPESERRVFASARAIVTTSEWARERAIDVHALPPDRVVSAAPGADPAPLADGSSGGGRLLCVAPVAPHKGQDVLVAALADLAGLVDLVDLADHGWSCQLVGSADRDPAFAAAVRAQIDAAGLTARIAWRGVLTGAALADAYAAVDLLVLPSRSETFGLVVTEALARGIPVVASEVGGVPEALGVADGADRAGRLVPPNDPAALAGVLRDWLTDPAVRTAWRAAARQRRSGLAGWNRPAWVLSSVLDRAGSGR